VNRYESGRRRLCPIMRSNPGHSFSCSSHLEYRAPFGVSVITHILRHTVGLLDEWSPCRRGLYLHRTTQHINTRKNIHAPSRESWPDYRLQWMRVFRNFLQGTNLKLAFRKRKTTKILLQDNRESGISREYIFFVRCWPCYQKLPSARCASHAKYCLQRLWYV
jgi:hypothetical protein